MTKALVVRRLYRSLLQSSKPFTGPSRDAAVISCLLHRTGMDDGVQDWYTLVTPYGREASTKKTTKDDDPLPKELARDLSKSYAELKEEFNMQASWQNSFAPDGESRELHRTLFRRLLRDVVAGSTDGMIQMPHPSQIDTQHLRNVIRREFRSEEGSISKNFDDSIRHQLAFDALRALNKKLAWAESLGFSATEDDKIARKLRNERQKARGVSLLPLRPPSSYLQPGCYLVAHPLLTGYFSRTVICLLEHTDGKESGGTYGVVVNRVGVSPTTGRDSTLRDVLRSDSFPTQLAEAFGDCSVREGGPVHMSLQMIHARVSQQEDQLGIGGTVLSTASGLDQISCDARELNRSIYFQGNISRAAEAVVNGKMDRDDVSFYVGASCWEAGQLESEMKRGFWFPCSGPPDIALTGVCSHDFPDQQGHISQAHSPIGDLWLSMICALGEEEAKLAHLLFKADSYADEDGGACDILQ